MDEEDRHYSVYLRPLLRLGPDGVKVRPMKKINATIAEIWAFKTNEVKTLYHIDEEDARCILRVAQNRCPPKLIERWD